MKDLLKQNLTDLAYTEYEDLPELPERAQVLAAEINVYKAQAGAAIIEIGRRLTEAKELLDHGQWLPWLRDRVEFSDSTAQRFMRLSKEYPNPSALTNLGVAKALALLALPPSDRDDFAAEPHVVNGEEKTVSEMSSRELAQAIRQRDQALKDKQEAEKNYKAEWEKNEELGLELEKLREEKESAAEPVREELERTKTAAEAREKELSKEILHFESDKADLEEKLQKAKEAKKKAEEKYKALKENPGADPEVLADLKAKAEQAVRAEAEAASAKKLKELVTQRDRAAEEQEAIRRAKEEAEAKIASLEKQLAMADPAVKEFQIYYQDFQETYNKMSGLLMKIEKNNQKTGAKLRTAMKAALTALLEKAG